MFRLILIIIVILINVSRLHAIYSNVESWKTTYAQYCSGTSQSPINITDADVVYDGSLQVPTWSPTKIAQGTVFIVKNDGKTLYVDTKNGQIKTTFMQTEYTLDGYHFHWSNNNNKAGSEHQVNGMPYSLEAHFVHFKSQYGTVANAIKNPDSLLVLGIPFQEQSVESNTNASFIERLLPSDFSPLSASVNSQMTMAAVDVPTEVGTDIFNEIVSYNGSLTTPNCNEVVSWFVRTKPLPVSPVVMAKFRGLPLADGDVMNYRNVQALNGRRVAKNFQGSVSSTPSRIFGGNQPQILAVILVLIATLTHS